ncbi:hypothetical protein SAMD00079811_00850 [Scytonema sp. HK-05]|nr:hypothetical protein SAMD00079811_00850 [Scytonema sp. HK-05]
MYPGTNAVAYSAGLIAPQTPRELKIAVHWYQQRKTKNN